MPETKKMLDPDPRVWDFETDHELGQDNIRPFGLDIHNPVFLSSSVLIAAFVLIALANQEAAAAFFGWLRPWLTSTFDWFLVLSVDAITLFCLALIVLPVGAVRIGGQDATPDYSYAGWIAMMFAAGIGIGLLFFGVLEPVYYNFSEGGAARPLNIDITQPGNEYIGIVGTIHHWGLEGWAVYAAVGLSLAIFCYNLGLPLTLRSAFYPILGERVWGWWGHVVDIVAVFATLFGLATSLGLGATQANAGLNELFGVAVGPTTQVLLITGITAIATVSVLRGLDGGVKVLSEINMGLAFLLLAFVLLVGPTLAILSTFGSSLLAYVEYLPGLSNPIGREDVNFMQGWTSFYWAWWISWSPFVGMFIARVSRGRSVREFLTCVLLIPSLVCVLWMSVFGGMAIDQVISHGYTAAQEAELPRQLFAMLDALPLAGITSLIGIVLVIVFFVTSSDSGSLVIDTITAGGKVDAPAPQRVFWCIFEGAVAIVLLLSAGGLKSLQSMVISTGLPFTVVLLFLCYAIFRGLRAEMKTQ